MVKNVRVTSPLSDPRSTATDQAPNDKATASKSPPTPTFSSSSSESRSSLEPSTRSSTVPEIVNSPLAPHVSGTSAAVKTDALTATLARVLKNDKAGAKQELATWLTANAEQSDVQNRLDEAGTVSQRVFDALLLV